eukprot:358456-Chlamydomonas_euryale.AAC.2
MLCFVDVAPSAEILHKGTGCTKIDCRVKTSCPWAAVLLDVRTCMCKNAHRQRHVIHWPSRQTNRDALDGQHGKDVGRSCSACAGMWLLTPSMPVLQRPITVLLAVFGFAPCTRLTQAYPSQVRSLPLTHCSDEAIETLASEQETNDG